MIPKKADNNHVDWLCPILLMEPDFNQNNKRLGHDLMASVEAQGGITPKQFSSRKGKAAVIQALNKHLVFNLLQKGHQAVVDTSVDLRSCYDLVVHMVVAMSMWWQGALDPPMVSMFSTLQGMEHLVCTAFSDLQWKFGGCRAAARGNKPPQGFSQDNGVALGG